MLSREVCFLPRVYGARFSYISRGNFNYPGMKHLHARNKRGAKLTQLVHSYGSYRNENLLALEYILLIVAYIYPPDTLLTMSVKRAAPTHHMEPCIQHHPVRYAYMNLAHSTNDSGIQVR